MKDIKALILEAEDTCVSQMSILDLQPLVCLLSTLVHNSIPFAARVGIKFHIDGSVERRSLCRGVFVFGSVSSSHARSRRMF